MAVCWVILRGQLIYTVIQAVHSLFYIVAKFNFFSVVTWKDILRYLQKYEGCIHFCEILYIYIYIYIFIMNISAKTVQHIDSGLVRSVNKGTKNNLWNVVETPDLTSIYRQQVTHHPSSNEKNIIQKVRLLKNVHADGTCSFDAEQSEENTLTVCRPTSNRRTKWFFTSLMAYGNYINAKKTNEKHHKSQYIYLLTQCLQEFGSFKTANLGQMH